tara:strand:+ start:1129525 stop:1130058 length:534 start_codon:yes stop_codon:yes gene_type:complete
MMDDSQLDRCMKLVTDCRERLARFVRVLVPSHDDAEEVVQQTMVTIWEQVDRFDRDGTADQFFAWASRIAVNHARNYVRKSAPSRLLFSPEAIEALAAQWDQSEKHLDERREALRSCLSELPEQERQLIQRRYTLGESTQSMSESLGRQATSVYRSLRRIHRVLETCINNKLEEVEK